MSIKIDIINPINCPGWNDLILNTQGYSFFHTSNWASVLFESYHFNPVYFSALANGHLSIVIPLMEVNSIVTGKRGISLPFSDFCNLVVGPENKLQDVLGAILEYGKASGWRYAEFRGDSELLHNETPSVSFYEHHLELCKDENKVFENFRDSTKRNIRKAEREDVKIEIHTTLASIGQYYHLHCITRKRHGVPPQPFIFFKKIYENILSKELGFVILAYHSKRIIAGAVYFYFGEKALFKFGASKQEYLSLRPNELVMWDAIKCFCQKGFKTFSFGRTDTANEGLRNFKCGWGSREKLINYFKYNFSQKAFIQDKQHLGTMQKKIFQDTPLPLLKLFGTLLYKHIA